MAGFDYVGGLVGYCGYSGKIENCYASASLTSDYNLGGLIGTNYSEEIINSFWNIDKAHSKFKSNLTNNEKKGIGYGEQSNSVYSKTSDEMKEQSFVDLLSKYANDTWAEWVIEENVNDGFPILDYNIPNPDKYWIGNAEEAVLNGNTYEIYTPKQLAWVAKEVNSGNDFSGKTIVLMNNLDLSEKYWTPIGKYDSITGDFMWFRGTFDGNNKYISNVKIGKTDALNSDYIYYGLFCSIKDAQIKNLSVINIDFNILYAEIVGGLVGVTDNSTVENCFVSGIINSKYIFYAGSIFGASYTNNNFNNSYAYVDIINANHAGGLGGYLDFSSIIKNSYYSGNIVAKYSIGGIIGLGGASNIDLQNCYFNTSTIFELDGLKLSGSNKSGIGNEQKAKSYGKTFNELKMRNTYQNWDFENIWAIDENINNGLPYLKAQIFLVDIPVQSIALNKTFISIYENESEYLVVVFTPTNASCRDIIWKSMDESIAIVDNYGKVTGVSKGRTIIEATSVDGEFKATCVVEVEEFTDNYTIESISIKQQNGEELNSIPKDSSFIAEISITSVKNTENGGYIIVASYNENDELIDLYYFNINLEKGKNIKIGCLVKNKDGKVKKLKAFAWDSLNNLIPISNVVIFE